MAKTAQELREQMEALQKELEQIEQAEHEVEYVEAEEVDELAHEVTYETIEDAEFTEVEGEEKPEEIRIITLINLGITENNQFIFDIQGESNILIVEGLRRFFNEKMDKEWATRIPEPIKVQAEEHKHEE